MKKILWMLLMAFLAVSISACGDDNKDENTDGQSGSKTEGKGNNAVTIPEYTDDGDCSSATVKEFCDGNKKVMCKASKWSVRDCDSWTCLWFPDLPNMEVDCEDGDINSCKTLGEKKQECNAASPDIGINHAYIANYECAKRSDGSLVWAYLEEDECDGTTCDGNQCGK